MDLQMATVLAKATTVVAFVMAATSSLVAQLSNSATSTAAAAGLSGLIVSSLALIKFLVTRATTDEGRSSEMWDDLRSERDQARERASRSYKTLDVVRAELATERAERIKWEAHAHQLVAEFRMRVGEEPSTHLG